MNTADVMVVGAGMAGASAALALARRGVRVVLADRSALPRDKVCGCCLNREAVGLLERAGLAACLSAAGAVPTRGIVVFSGGRAARFASRGGLAVSRRTLDGLIVDAARRAGCELLASTSASIEHLPERADAPVRVRCRGRGVGGERVIEARLVLVADGLAGSCLSAVEGAERAVKQGSLRGYGVIVPAASHHAPAGEVVMRCGEAGYVGTVVLEDGSLDVAAAMRPDRVKRCGGPARAAAQLAQAAGSPLEVPAELTWRATASLTGGRRRVAWPGVCVLGDAAGYVEPFTGEGMAWALRSADAVVPIALDALTNGMTPALQQRWTRAHRTAVGRRQWRCRACAALLRRPTLTRAVIGAAGRLPPRARYAASRAALPSAFPPVLTPAAEPGP